MSMSEERQSSTHLRVLSKTDFVHQKLFLLTLQKRRVLRLDQCGHKLTYNEEYPRKVTQDLVDPNAPMRGTH